MLGFNVRMVALPFLFSVAATAIAQDHSTETSQVNSLDKLMARQADLNLATAPIRSRSDLFAYLRGVAAPVSPLSKLSPGARERFLASLTFNENGLTGFSYEDLRIELTATEIYRVLSLFGAQHDTALIGGVRIQSASDAQIMENPLPPDDHEGYACVGRATCNTRPSFICMSGC